MISVEEALARLLAPLEAARRRAGVARRGARPRPRRGCRGAPHAAALRRLGDGRLCGARRGCGARCRPSCAIVAEVPAGAGFGGTVGAGEAARIFTGAPLPDGRRHDRHPGGHRARRRSRQRARRRRRAAATSAAPGSISPRATCCCTAGRRLTRARYRPRRGDEPAVAVRASPAARRHPVDRRRDRHAGRSDRAAPDRQLERAGARGLRHAPAAACRCRSAIAPDDPTALRRIAAGGARRRPAGHDRRRLGRRARSGARRARRRRARARFLADRDAAGQAADGRPLSRHADARPARQSGLDPGLRAAVSCSRRSTG